MQITHLKVLAGSHAYGFATPESDKDTRGVCWEGDLKEVLGFGRFRQKEDKDTDTIFHSFPRLVFLTAVKTSFTQLDITWAPEDCILEKDSWGEFLLNNKEKFLASRGIYDSCRGFARGQLHFVDRQRPEERLKREPQVIEYEKQYRKAQHHSLRTLWQAKYCFKNRVWPVRVVDYDKNMAKLLMDIKKQAWSYDVWLTYFNQLMMEVDCAFANTALLEITDQVFWEQAVIDYNLWLIDKLKGY